MADSDVSYWLAQAGRYPLLTAEQEIHYGTCVRRWYDWEGGKDAAPKKVARAGKRSFDRMFNCNLRLCSAVVKKYLMSCTRTGAFNQADLLQIAAIGLIRAVEKFDPATGYKFSTYAYWWIRQGVSRGVMKTSPIKVPHTQIDFYRRWLYRKAGTTIEQFAENEGQPVKWCLEMIERVQRADSIASLDKQVNDDEKSGTTADTIVADNPDPLDEMDREVAMQALAEAYPKEMKALEMRIIDEANTMEIAKMLGHNSPKKVKDFLYNAKPRLELVAKNVDADLLLSA
jgi:RNA polymerase sigma factor (sigma-70 family)